MDRRSFLRPGSLWKLANAMSEGEANPQQKGGAIVSFRQESMACLFEFQIPATEKNRDAVFEALALVEDVEARLSIYRDESEISQINRSSAGEWTVVSAETFALLQTCNRLSEETERAFDITAGPLLDAWGISAREGRIPAAEELAMVRARVGWSKLELDVTSLSVRFLEPGMKLNLGAIGKGYALDRAADMLRRNNVNVALLSAGHSSIAALGRPAWDSEWRIDLRDPANVENTIGQLQLADRMMSTTGISEQKYSVDERMISHILDPRIGEPAVGSVLQATIVGAQAAVCEALSTACFLLGPQWSKRKIESMPGYSAILVSQDDAAKAPKVAIFGDSSVFRGAS